MINIFLENKKNVRYGTFLQNLLQNETWDPDPKEKVLLIRHTGKNKNEWKM